MAYQKVNHVLILFLAALLMMGCKKESKTYTTVTWEIINPVTGEGFSGVPVSLYEVRYGSSASYLKIWSGTTNENGLAVHKFKAYTSTKYGYTGSADLSVLGVLGIDYSVIKQPSPGQMLKNTKNKLRYEIVPYGDYVQHTKNIDCQGVEDKMRLRRKFIYTGKGENEFSDWFPNEELNGFSYIEGCYENISDDPIQIPSDSILFEIEVTKNGITEILYEKFYVGPEQVDTIKIYY